MNTVKFFYLLGNFSFLLHCTQVSETVYSGSYLGLSPSDSSAEIFAPGFINTGMATRDITFSPDGKEIFFCVNIGNHNYSTILYTEEQDGEWTQPIVAPFAENLEYMYIEPHFSSDGSKLYFASNQPPIAHPDETGNTDIWFVNRMGKSWGEPNNLGQPVNSEDSEFYPTLTENGTLYFTRDNPKSGISYIYRSKQIDGKFQTPELLPEQINAGRSRFNAFIAPDESYIILPIFGLPDTFGGTDYYISHHRADDTWSDPIHLDALINSESRLEYSASVSPEGKYLFFMSSGREPKKSINKERITIDDLNSLHNMAGNGNSSIYWIKTELIPAILPHY